MATVNLGRVKPVNKGTWSSATTYAIDDFVQYTDSGVLSTYIAVAASSNQTPSTSGTENGTYWKYMSKGTTLAVGNNKVVVSDGSGNLTGQTIGTAGQVLKVNSGANGFEFGGAGDFSIHKIDSYTYATNIATSGGTQYIDIAGGNTVSFQPTSTDDKVFISHSCHYYIPNVSSGHDVYMMMKEGSSAIGSGDTKLNYDGNHAVYVTNTGIYGVLHKSFILPCTGLNTSSVYYLEQAGANHTATTINHNHSSSQASGNHRSHVVNLLHYKKN